MFNELFARMKTRVGNDIAPPPLEEHGGLSKRRFTRRSCDICVSKINGHSFPVVDWSLGGLQVAGDTRVFSIDDIVEVELKFKLSNRIVSIPHKARVVRKTCEKLGLEFRPLTDKMRGDFYSVVEDYSQQHA